MIENKLCRRKSVYFKHERFIILSNRNQKLLLDAEISYKNVKGIIKMEGVVSAVYIKIGQTHKVRKENLKPRKPVTDKIEFIQCNLQKSQTGQIEINHKIKRLNKENARFICLVQEPFSSRSKIIHQPNTVQKFSNKGIARAAIYVDKGMAVWSLDNLTTRDVVAIQTTIGKQEVVVVSAYMDINKKTLETAAITKMIDYVNRQGLGLIIGMDSNCHSTLFGPKQNERGHLFDRLIANNDLSIENVGHDPTNESRGARTCIDATLSRHLHRAIKGWEVDRSYNGSDHNTIAFRVETDVIEIPAIWQWHKADWKMFEDEMIK